MASKYDKSLLKFRDDEENVGEDLNLDKKISEIIEARRLILNEARYELEWLIKSTHPLLYINFSFSKNLSYGVLIENEHRVKLTKIKGKFIHYMGYSEQHDEASNSQNIKLYPEEALFLIENVRVEF